MRLCSADIGGDMCAVFGRPGVKYCKANRSIIDLRLFDNKIGDKGACALADALRATLVPCLPHVRATGASGHDGYTLTVPDSYVFCSPLAGLFLQLCSGNYTCLNFTRTDIHMDTISICRLGRVIFFAVTNKSVASSFRTPVKA